MECQLIRGKRDKRAGSVSRDTPVATDQSEMSYWEVCEQSRGWWEGRGHLHAPSDEPDLVPATGNARVLVRGHHVVIGAEVVRHAHNLPQQADLAAHRLLRGRPKERPVSQRARHQFHSCLLLNPAYLVIFWPLLRQVNTLIETQGLIFFFKSTLNYFLVLKGIVTRELSALKTMNKGYYWI